MIDLLARSIIGANGVIDRHERDGEPIERTQTLCEIRSGRPVGQPYG
jgi:hypothetical protein